ncbi:MAG: type I-E CRISPR-associated protein Cas6/Cse3/CasE [Zoogloea sp.]|uniref:type I-E CRISPR-associated protein Cas6/Cse3/CasE n=1 Tax=Zoogloea sp. TaxID=49181 RepID=UPI00262A3214|nr:type I-E CRISPR-associated protein Cas6/Cse3/CasE [Zoogloea sp.]MDD2989350.1 type I-E CRISPR-associated protein Cas6/Cse3/CasE [Zoogloea sp.]
MFLAKLVLDGAFAHVRRDLSDAYQLHRTLVRFFADNETSPPRRFLWRLEADAGQGAVGAATVLIQSAQPGNWEAIENLEGYRLAGQKEVVLDALLRRGRHYSFRLLANPTVTRAGKRYGLVGEEAQREWLSRQAERNGFALRESVVTGSSRLTVKQSRSGHRMTVDTVRFDGVLTVEDVGKVHEVLINGLGHAKALGLGLLSIAPLQS